MESYKTWSTYHKVAGNENDLLLITSDEFEGEGILYLHCQIKLESFVADLLVSALKKKVEATLKHDVNFELKFNCEFKNII